MAGKENPVLEEKAKRCLGAMKQYRRPMRMRELCAIAGMTVREGDLAVKWLKRNKLAKYEKDAEAGNGWVLTATGRKT